MPRRAVSSALADFATMNAILGEMSISRNLRNANPLN